MHWLILTLSLGALGVALRWWVITWLGVTSFPWATLLVNVGGSGVIGLLYADMVFRGHSQWGPFAAALAVGFLGGVTTYSSYSLDVIRLGESGLWTVAATYVLAQNLFCIGACWLAYRLGLELFKLI